MPYTYGREVIEGYDMWCSYDPLGNREEKFRTEEEAREDAKTLNENFKGDSDLEIETEEYKYSDRKSEAEGSLFERQ